MSLLLIQNKAHGQTYAAKLYLRGIWEHHLIPPIAVRPEVASWTVATSGHLDDMRILKVKYVNIMHNLCCVAHHGVQH